MDTSTDRCTVAAAAKRLGVSKDSIYKRISRGTLPVYRVDGRTFVVVDSPSTPTDTPRSTDSLDWFSAPPTRGVRLPKVTASR